MNVSEQDGVMLTSGGRQFHNAAFFFQIVLFVKGFSVKLYTNEIPEVFAIYYVFMGVGKCMRNFRKLLCVMI